MRLRTPKDIGLTIRERRRDLGLTQATLAKRIGAGRQWVIEVEKGKPRAELGLVLRAFKDLGLVLRIEGTSGPGSSGSLPEASINIDDVIEAHRKRPDGRP